jgi:hypothetical protein
VSKGSASTIVLVSGGILVALALLSGKQGEDRYKAIWAAGLLTVALGVAADFLPELVGPFAGLVIVAAVIKNPGTIGAFVNQKVSSTATTGGAK